MSDILNKNKKTLFNKECADILPSIKEALNKIFLMGYNKGYDDGFYDGHNEGQNDLKEELNDYSKF